MNRARAPLKQRATITGARLYSEDARALAIEHAAQAIERELHQHFDVHQRIVIHLVLSRLADDAMRQCSNRRGLCW